MQLHVFTRTLAANGYPDFATSRKDRELEALSSLPNVTPVRMDVRDMQQVQEAVELVIPKGQQE